MVRVAGYFAPLALLWWLARVAEHGRILLARACRAFAIYGLIYFFVALAVDLPPHSRAWRGFSHCAACIFYTCSCLCVSEDFLANTS